MKKVLIMLGLSLGLLVTGAGIAQDTKTAKKEMKEADKSAKKAAKAETKAAKDATKDTEMADRMAKARAAKAEKKAANDAGKVDMTDGAGLKDDKMSKSVAKKEGGKAMASAVNRTTVPNKAGMKEEKATPADYKAPVDKSQKGPSGEVVYTGPRGGKYYINKNGNKTYLSSNQ
ncbi:hypothetical protein GCM10027341_03320 [Spirosoma knui]